MRQIQIPLLEKGIMCSPCGAGINKIRQTNSILFKRLKKMNKSQSAYLFINAVI